jgi:hypothetical protein
MSYKGCLGRTETIHRYLDQDLSSAEKEPFLVHLQACAACQSLLADLQLLFTDLASLEEIEPPLDLVTQVMARLPAPSKQRKLVGQFFLAGQMLIGLILLVFGFPFLHAFLNHYLSFSPREALLSMFYALTDWGVDIAQALNYGWLQAWPSLGDAWDLSISPGNALIIVVCLGLIWLAGNFLLLGQPSQFLKNRGAS